MNYISVSNSSLPKELWAEVILHTEDPQLVLVSKLFRDLYYDQNQVFKWLHNSLSSRGIFDVSCLLKTPGDLSLVKHELVTRVISYRPKNTLEYVRDKETLPIHGYVKLLREERAINLIHVYERIPLEKPDFADLQVQAKALAIQTFFKENRQKIELIENLDLSNIHITVVPEELELFTGLKEIFLQANYINYLPSSFGKTWEKLEKCDLSINQSLVLPKNFGSAWKNLTDLNLNYTHLSELPSDFGNTWEKLENLNIDYNKLKTFPDSYKQWKKIKTIQFKRNPLLPDTCQKMKSVFPRLLFF